MHKFSAAIDALKNGDFQSRWQAVKQLSSSGDSFGGDEVLPLLLELLQVSGTDFERQWFLVKLLGQFQQTDAILALVKVLETSIDEDVCNQAAQSLAEMGGVAIAHLAPLLEDPLRFPTVVKALAQMGQPEGVPLLIDAFPRGSAEIRVLILNALDQFQDDRILGVLRQGLQDAAAAVCQAAIAGLTIQHNISVEEKVWQTVPFLGDPRSEVSDQAARSLGQLGTDAATLALVQQCCNPETSPHLQQTLIRALGWIGSLLAVDGLVKVWERVSQVSPLPEPLLQEVLASFAQMKSPEVKAKAAQSVLELLRSPHLECSTKLKSSAILSLGRIADLSMMSDLIDLLANPDYRVRLHVVAALKQVSADKAYQAIQDRSELRDLEPVLTEGLAIALREW